LNYALRGLEGGQYKPLCEGDIKVIHELSARLLEETGIRVTNKEVLQKFKEAGAEVDCNTSQIRIPRSLLEDAIASAPSQILLSGRDENNDLLLKNNRTYMGTGGTVLYVLDPYTGERRRATLKDLQNAARLAESLDNLHFFMLPLYPLELDISNVDVNRFQCGLMNTSKHVMGGVYTVEGIREVIKMAEEMAGGAEQLRKRPLVSMVTCVMSPLLMDDVYASLLMEVAYQGIPLVCPAEPMAGATGPVTLAGTLAISNAETLSGLVLAQIVNRGTPTIYGTVASTMDMKNGSYLSGAVEMGLLNAASVQLARFYDLPIYATAGMSDSKMPDVQAGYEKATSAMMVALAGANFIHDAAGFLDFCSTFSFEQMVIDDEIIGLCMRALKGIEVNENTLAEEVIKRVGPGGNFLTSKHTLDNYRNEMFFPTIGDRRSRRSWEKNGKLDALYRARDKVHHLFSN